MNNGIGWLFFLFAMPACAAQQEETVPVERIYFYQQAEFKGGEDSLRAFVRHHIQYPDLAREAGIQGRVLVRFVVNENGNTSDVVVLRRLGGGCDEEALKMVGAMPAWKPATICGQPAKAVEVLPVEFKLQ